MYASSMLSMCSFLLTKSAGECAVAGDEALPLRTRELPLGLQYTAQGRAWSKAEGAVTIPAESKKDATSERAQTAQLSTCLHCVTEPTTRKLPTSQMMHGNHFAGCRHKMHS
jgi:hypothetical protein